MTSKMVFGNFSSKIINDQRPTKPQCELKKYSFDLDPSIFRSRRFTSWVACLASLHKALGKSKEVN